ncbi:MAG: lipoyl(octanoyl) transferase LipB [Gemmatimonadota bacterium]|nr:lipoyl(octanoyl) transferase LipB [Gemmatimonadota bacterium]MDE2872573.1 lipoyl(octanoyl) transferase LipB [Gemmatimonadota bacterium]
MVTTRTPGAANRSCGPSPPASWGHRTLAVRYPGRTGYPEALELQAALVERRRNGEIPDTLLLLEHPHVVTLGSAGGRGHLRDSPGELAARGIGVYEAGRGGDVTYHGPGQLVGYPILDLKPDRRDLHAYLRSLEKVLVGALRTFGVDGRRGASATGVWAGGAKVAAIGIRVSSGWITSHGFALNVSTDLSYFDAIVPCGLHGCRVTSVSRLLGHEIALDAVAPALVRAMAEEFGYGSVDDSSPSSGANSK